MKTCMFLSSFLSEVLLGKLARHFHDSLVNIFIVSLETYSLLDHGQQTKNNVILNCEPLKIS